MSFMLISTPYTYLIGWSKHNLWYYGVRTSTRSTLGDIWKTYFTSSKRVQQLRQSLGEPDVVEVRRTFDNAATAKRWEERVLRRINAKHNLKWINLSNNNSFRGVTKPWNFGLNKTNSEKMKEIGNNISKSLKKRNSTPGYVSPMRGRKLTEAQKIADRWRQLNEHHPHFPFENYQQFANKVVELHTNERLGPYTIANLYDVDGGAINRILGKVGNQSWSKILKRKPDFPFDSYEKFCSYCFTEVHTKGRKRWHLVKELGLSEDAIKRAIRHGQEAIGG